MAECNRKITTISFNLDEQRELNALKDATGIQNVSLLLKTLMKRYLYEYRIDYHQDKYLPEAMKERTRITHDYKEVE